MPEPDPKAGRTYIWTISCALFICIAVGGGCLFTYLILPDSQSSSLLAVLGFTLVCLPWIFWTITVVYRITSRAFGFRMVIGDLYGNHAAAGVNNDIDGAQILDVNNAKSPPTSPEDDGRDTQFDEAKNGDICLERNIKKANGSSSSNSNDISVASYESELPLALSMVKS